MSFWIDLTDLAHITVTPDIPNRQPLAWHEGRLVPPIQLAHDTSPTVLGIEGWRRAIDVMAQHARTYRTSRGRCDRPILMRRK